MLKNVVIDIIFIFKNNEKEEKFKNNKSCSISPRLYV